MWKEKLREHQGQWRQRWRRCSRHQSQDSPAPRGENHGEAAASLQSMEVSRSSEIHLNPKEEIPATVRDAWKEAVVP